MLDVNDNPPVFVPGEYQKIIDGKTAIGTTILKVNVTDADSTNNGKMELSISGGNLNNTFSIKNTGVITLRNSLKGLQTAVFNLSITAKDLGTPPKRARIPAIVYIKIKDRDDCLATKRPSFPLVIYKAEVAENSPIGTPVLQVRAKSCKYR